MDLVYEDSLPLPDLVSRLDMGNQSEPGKTTVDPLQGWSTAEGEPGASSQGACLKLHWGQEGAGAWVCQVEKSGIVCVDSVFLFLMGLQCFLGTGHVYVPLMC